MVLSSIISDSGNLTQIVSSEILLPTLVTGILRTTQPANVIHSHFHYDNNCNKVNRSLEQYDITNCTRYKTPVNLPQPMVLVMYLMALISLFVGTAILCDDYFVPSLEVISEKLNLSGAVAGATFMAAGSSGPEFFASCISLAFETDIGVGTITGSAVFNILVIVASTALYVQKELMLDWRPLARDGLFYLFSVIIFVYSVGDTFWTWWEALVMVLTYIIYVLVLMYDHHVMCFLTRVGNCFKKQPTRSSVRPLGILAASPPTHDGKPPIRRDGTQSTHFVNRHRNMSFIQRLDSSTMHSSIRSGKATIITYSIRFSKTLSRVTMPSSTIIISSESDESLSDDSMKTDAPKKTFCAKYCCVPEFSVPVWETGRNCKETTKNTIKFILKWMMLVCGMPFIVLFTYTIPDCNKNRRWYPLTFTISMVWIATITALTVLLIIGIGCLIDVHHFVLSLIFLAAGTSIPDMLSSMIVAKEGQGDMAMSNALGSNVFDINFGLGFPLLLSFALKNGVHESAFSVKDRQTFCESNKKTNYHQLYGILLLLILVVSIIILILEKFRLTKRLGVIYVCLYFIFVALAFAQPHICETTKYWC